METYLRMMFLRFRYRLRFETLCAEVANMATDMASVRPLRSASSDSSAVPAWDTRFFPSVVTLIDRVARLSCTFKEPSWFWRMRSSATHILPEQGGFSADAGVLESGARRIFEARAAWLRVAR
jgi:IS5 family transposase